MTLDFERNVQWFEARQTLVAIWTRTSEPVPWIAATADELLEGLSRSWGIPRWTTPEGAVWEGTAANREAIIEAAVVRHSDGRPHPPSGYRPFFAGPGERVGAEVSISAGAVGLAPNFPNQRLSIIPLPVRGTALTPAMLDDMCDLVARVWEPTQISIAPVEVRKLGDRHNGWAVDRGHRLWLSDDAATIDYLADGVTATRMHGGTMLAVPDDWSPEQVVETVGETLERNGITEIPH